VSGVRAEGVAGNNAGSDVADRGDGGGARKSCPRGDCRGARAGWIPIGRGCVQPGGIGAASGSEAPS